MTAITTRDEARTRYDELLDLIDQAITDAGRARTDHDADHADWLWGHADRLESELLELADRFSLDE